MELWKRNLYLTWSGQILGMIGFAMVIPYIPIYIEELGVPDKNEAALITGLISTLAFILMAIMAPLWGVLGDRYGRKSMLTRAMFGGFVIVGAMCLVQDVWQLSILRVAQGAITGTIPAAVALVASLTPQARMGYSLGLMQTAVFSGQTIGPFIGGLMGDLIGHRAMFGISGVMLLLAGLLIQFGVQENFVKPEKVAGEGVWNRFASGIAYTVKQKEVLKMSIILALVSFTMTIVFPIMPVYVSKLGTLSDGMGLSTSVGIIVGITGILSAISSTVFGQLSDKWGHLKVLIFCAIGSFIFYVPQAIVATSLGLLLTRAGMGIFVGGINPTANTIINNMTPKEKRGAVYGAVTSIGAIGLAAGPIIGSSLAAFADVRLVFMTSAVMMLIIAGWSFTSRNMLIEEAKPVPTPMESGKS
jgi:DHA1 family multidrug resistance protein-like MFS transporter